MKCVLLLVASIPSEMQMIAFLVSMSHRIFIETLEVV